jgi:hypothetical protein
VSKGFYQLRDVSFEFAVVVEISVRIDYLPYCCLCGLHMHQPLPAISAVLGQEPVEWEAEEMLLIWDDKVVISCLPFRNHGEVDSMHIQKLIRNVRIVKDLLGIVPNLPS